jgi:hypothetical protein
LEPIFAAYYERDVLAQDGTPKAFTLTDYELDLWRRTTGSATGVPDGFVTAGELPISAT